MNLIDLQFSAEIAQQSVTDQDRRRFMFLDRERKILTIRLSRADFENGNVRYYTDESMAAAAIDPDTQEQIALGLMVLHIEHPDPIFDGELNVVGFNKAQKIRAGWFRKLWYQQDSKELLADVEPMPTAGGRYLIEQLEQGKPIKFSLRALGDCVIDEQGRNRCAIDKIDGGDQVETPAMPDAEVIAVTTLTDSNNLIKSCCNSCKQPHTCERKSHPVIKTPTRTEQPLTPLGDKSRLRPCVSGQSRRTRTLGDANMYTAEQLKMIESETDIEQLKKMIAFAGSGGASAPEPMMEEKKKEEEPMVETAAPPAVYDEKKITDSVNKTLDEKLKNIIDESEMNALKELTKQRATEAAKKAVTDSIKAIEVAGEVEGRKLVNYSEQELRDAMALASNKESVEAAKQSLVDSFSMLDNAKLRAITAGVKIVGGAGKGSAVALIDEGDKAADGAFAQLEIGVKERIRNLRGEAAVTEYEERAKINKPFVDQLLSEHRKGKSGKALADWGKRVMTDSANLITESDLRNQEGVLAAMMIKQVYQKLVGLQFCKNVTSPGRQIKIPLWSYTPPTAGTTRRFYEVRSGEDIAQAESAIRYYKMFSRLYALSFSIGEELLAQLADGPLGISASGMLIGDISDDLRRQIDTRILHEHQHTCDQFQAGTATAEAVALAEWTAQGVGGKVAGALIVDVGGDIGNVTYGSNVDYAAKLLTGYATTYTGHPRPIVEPKTTYTIDDDNLGAFGETYSVTVATLGGVTQVRGYLDADGVIRALVPGTIPTFAVDNEHGVVVFAATGTSGAAAGTRPTITYRYATNYNEFNLTPVAGTPPENHYAGLLRMMLQMKAVRSAAPFYRNFNTALFHTAIGTGAFAIADLFENQRSPTDTKLLANFAEGDAIGALSGLAVLQNNGDFFAGARRAILFEREMVAYGVTKAMEVTGPIQSQSSGVLQPDSIWWARHIDVVDTPVLKNSAGTIIQHPGRSIRFVGSLSSTAAA